MGLTEGAFCAQLEARGTHFRAPFMADCGSLQYCNRYCNRAVTQWYTMGQGEHPAPGNTNNGVHFDTP